MIFACSWFLTDDNIEALNCKHQYTGKEYVLSVTLVWEGEYWIESIGYYLCFGHTLPLLCSGNGLYLLVPSVLYGDECAETNISAFHLEMTTFPVISCYTCFTRLWIQLQRNINPVGNEQYFPWWVTVSPMYSEFFGT